MPRRHKKAKHVYAILRYDEFYNESVDLESRITVKAIVWTPEQAEAEVQRLNKLNSEKGCRYWWVLTRLYPPEIEPEPANSGI